MTIHISGSLAYDRIMTFPGQFEDHIIPEKLHIINLSFMVERLEERRGGTAGNIAYNLALLGEAPAIYGAVGRDFEAYGRALEAMGVGTGGVRVLEENLTACAYITTDRKSNQITGFNPAAMGTPCDPAFLPRLEKGDWGIVSPGNIDDMAGFPEFYRSHATPYIYDPGQQIPVLSAEKLVAGLTGASVLVGNDYEIELISSKTGLSKAQLMERVDYLITTLGEKGSEVVSRFWEQPRYIKAVEIQEVFDPTGAGDAFRSGLVKGLQNGLDMDSAAELGAVCASFAIEKYGTQEHSFTKESFTRRYEQTYGQMPYLDW